MKILCINHNNRNNVSFGQSRVHAMDLAYKKIIQQGLKDTFQLNCKLEDLNPIMGPFELKEIISKLRPAQYIANDDFRANFHLHTVASDGRLTASEFLEQCKAWADEIFAKMKSKDDLPPFSAAITDHNAIKSTLETIALISQNPDKYKNFKFAVGCEFFFDGYKKPNSKFEAVGLGFNPFSPELMPMFKGSDAFTNDIADAKKVLSAGGVLSFSHPISTPDKINDDFFSFLKSQGINGVEGNYQYFYVDKENVAKGNKLLEPLIRKYNMFLTGGTDSHRKSIFSRH